METLIIKTEIDKNRLYFILKGFFLPSEVDLVLHKLNREIEKLKPGYDIITDIREFLTNTEDLKKVIVSSIERLKTSELRNFVMITEKSVVTNFFGNWDFKIITDTRKSIKVSSLEEGDFLLDSMRHLNEICLS